MYHLYEPQINACIPLSEKVGLLYCDTDSVFVDNGLCKIVDFPISEDILYYDDITRKFQITWKRKYSSNKIIEMAIRSKKDYSLIGEKEKIIENKVKGVKTEFHDGITYETIKKILDDKPAEFKFSALVKRKQDIYKKSSVFSNTKKDLIKEIFQVNSTKKIKREHDFIELKITNKNVIEKNQKNFNRDIYKDDIKNFLCFIDY
jgi:hypothetical protein